MFVYLFLKNLPLLQKLLLGLGQKESIFHPQNSVLQQKQRRAPSQKPPPRPGQAAWPGVEDLAVCFKTPK